MKKHIGILGRLVMVHPHLTTDPIQRQGDIGKVVNVSALDENVLTVEFSDGKQGAYMSDGLLTLYPKSVIRQGLQSNLAEYPADIRKGIIDILKLVEDKMYRKALERSVENESLRFFCTTLFRDWIEMKRLKRQIAKGRRKKL